MSALERLSQTRAKISYWERRAVIGEDVVTILVVCGIGFRESLWCVLGGVSRWKSGMKCRRKSMVCACVAVRMRIEVMREGANEVTEKREATAQHCSK
jgi:hypothetical protein